MCQEGLPMRNQRCHRGSQKAAGLAVTALLCIIITLLSSLTVTRASNSVDIEPEFEKVTCGSAVKLTHKDSGYKLHSHEIPYGSGSGQQSVTGFPNRDDPNSLFIIHSAFDQTACARGEPIKCGSKIRLQHVMTGNYLHSHDHRSPITQNQEVSAYHGQNSGDDWFLVCPSQDEYWTRENAVRLKHVDSLMYLHSHKSKQYGGHPVQGQLEVCGVKGPSAQTLWVAMEGIYFADKAALT